MRMAIPKALRAAALLALAVLAASCAGAPPARDLQPARTAEALVFHAGTRVDQDGVPVLDLRGSRYEVGLQYGVLLRPEIRSVFGEFNGLLDELTGGGLARFVFRLSLGGKINEMRAALPPGYEEEVRGIAEGAGIPFGEYLFFVMTPELLFDANCTSVILRQGDSIYHARNFDFPRPANRVSAYPAIVKVSVDGKIPYVNVGFAGLPGVYTGLNQAGIAASVNTAAFTRQAGHSIIPVGFLVKSILENAGSLAEVDRVMGKASASHYFIMVSSRAQRDGALYESLADAVTRVPMTGSALGIANEPLSAANRRANASILSEAEYNTAREHELQVLTTQIVKEQTAQEEPVDYLLQCLGNHDFYGYSRFPVHQTLIQDSFKTINNFNTIQSVVVDWPGNQVIFSYRSSYAGFGPFHAYDLTTGRISPWRPADPFVTTGSFSEDTAFLDQAFALSEKTGMKLNRQGWQQILDLIDTHPGLNPFLKSDWTFSASLALGKLDEARGAAQRIEQTLPDYYLGPFYLGLAAWGNRDWQEAKMHFLASEARPINSPATRLLALSYASVASRKLGDTAQADLLEARARSLLNGYWIPQDLDARLKSYVGDGEVADFIRGLAREER